MKPFNYLILAPLLFATAASAKPRLKLDFDEGHMVGGKASATLMDRNGASIRAVIDKGTRAKDRPAVVTQDCKTPPGCLRISLDPSAPGAAKNKIMFPFWSHIRPLPGGESGRLILGDNKPTTFSFDMKLAADYDTPTHALLHFQVVQPNNGPQVKGQIRQGGPVMSLNIVPRSKRRIKDPDVEEFVFAIRNSNADKFVNFDRRDPTVLYRGKIKKGEWNNFVVSFRSRKLNDKAMGGPIVFKQNGVVKVDQQARWGFVPANPHISKTASLELGIYRTPDVRGTQTVYFDNISLDR